jgi:hypothetical protein
LTEEAAGNGMSEMSSGMKKEEQSSCREHNIGGDFEPVFAHEVKLQIARILYRAIVGQFPDRLVMLYDQEHMLASSDRPETMPPLS